MADRDKIPSKVPSQFKGVYQQIRELQAPEAVAQSALRPLRKAEWEQFEDSVTWQHKKSTKTECLKQLSLVW